MARIRTIKPEFWTDDLIGSLARDHRLLFIATWNLADDEGLLRWSAPYLKGAVFPYDDDIGIADVESAMETLVGARVVFPYLGGRSQQKLAYVVNFHKHQKVNRPSPSKLPPPSLQSSEVRDMYGFRDGLICHLCGFKIDESGIRGQDDFIISIDHIIPLSKGGTDYPSNLKASHQTCNKGRGDRGVEEYKAILTEGKTAAQRRHPERFISDSLNGSLNGSCQEEVMEWDRSRTKNIVDAEPASTPDVPENEEKLKRVPSARTELVRTVGEAWNELAASAGLSQVAELYNGRQAHILARGDDLVKIYEFPDPLAGFKHLFGKIRGSPFLLGQTQSKGGGPSFRCDLDFAVNKSSFTKIMEGKYEDRPKGQSGR